MTDDRGAVTVEAAIALSALTAFLVLAVTGLLVVIDQIRCVDAAHAAARLAARGEPERGRQVAVDLAPEDADVRIRGDGDTVAVDVHAVARLPGVRPHADAYAVVEPGADLAPG